MVAEKSLINAFDFPSGTMVSGKYEIIGQLGTGWEGEVYKIIETNTGIERAAKFFFPHRNRENRVASRYAKMLHKLNTCPIVIQYYAHEFIQVRDKRVTCLISELVDGELLSDFLERQPHHRIGLFRGLHLLHALAKGLESMHVLRSYHGDLHTDNIMIKRAGLGFELKLLDMHHWGGNDRKINMEEDICDAIRIFHASIGGQKMYAKHPPEIKHICCGLKKTLIKKKFKTATHLRHYLEGMTWTTSLNTKG